MLPITLALSAPIPDPLALPVGVAPIVVLLALFVLASLGLLIVRGGAAASTRSGGLRLVSRSRRADEQPLAA